VSYRGRVWVAIAVGLVALYVGIAAAVARLVGAR
jgi:hypothetical protein